MPNRRLNDPQTLEGIVRVLLAPPARRAIIACTRRGLGDARDLATIRRVAREKGARPLVVAAAFGYLPDARRPGRTVDVVTGYDEDTLGLLPSDPQVRAAFALWRAVAPEGASFVVE